MIEFEDLIGTPFAYNGRGPDFYDCYGVVLEMYRRWSGIEVPDYVSPSEGSLITGLFHDAIRHWMPADVRPGVMIAMRVPGNVHLGFIVDHHRMIHAWEGSGGVVVEPYRVWDRRIMGAYHYEG